MDLMDTAYSCEKFHAVTETSHEIADRFKLQVGMLIPLVTVQLYVPFVWALNAQDETHSTYLQLE